MNVDFVAITALLMGLAIMLISLISAGVEAMSNSIRTEIGGIQVRKTFDTAQSGQNGDGGETDHQFGFNDPVATSTGSNDQDQNGPAGQTQGGSTGQSQGGMTDPVQGASTSPPQGGNPGNNKAVGKAGENPNGQGGWGSGSNGRSR